MVATTNLLRAIHRIVPQYSRYRLLVQRSANACMVLTSNSCQTLAAPSPDGQPKEYPQKIVNLVDSISQLTLLEVSDLNELLKSRLNISDAPMAVAAAPQSAPAAQETAEEEEVQTEFSVKLMKFDDASKVKLIKEIKALVDGMNLVQAKKYVESLPQTVKKGIPKEEAEQLKKTLEAVGATVVIE